jgi:hypothetical protein
VGGGAGASAALSGDEYNRQLHRTESEWIEANAAAYAKQHPGMTVDQAESELAQQAYRQVQSGVSGAWNADASQFLQTAGRDLWTDPAYPGQTFLMFQATSFEQRQDTSIFAGSQHADIAFYQSNGLKPVTPANAAAWEAMRISANKTSAEQSGVILASSFLSPAMSAYVAASGGSTAVGLLVGRGGAGLIGGTTNAAFQLGGDQPFNPFSTGIAFATGALAFGQGAMTTVAINAGGRVANAYLNNTFLGANDNVWKAGGYSGLAALVGWSAGYGVNAGYSKWQSLSPTARLNAQDRVPLGNSIYAPSGPPSAAVISANMAGATSQETAGMLTTPAPSKNQGQGK